MVGVLLGEVVEQLIGLYLAESWSTGSSSLLDACGNAQNANNPPGVGGIIGGGASGAGNKARNSRNKKGNSPPADPDESIPVLRNEPDEKIPEEDETAISLFEGIGESGWLGKTFDKAFKNFESVYRKDDFLKDSDDERRDE
jgi:hypothetical protein